MDTRRRRCCPLSMWLPLVFGVLTAVIFILWAVTTGGRRVFFEVALFVKVGVEWGDVFFPFVWIRGGAFRAGCPLGLVGCPALALF